MTADGMLRTEPPKRDHDCSTGTTGLRKGATAKGKTKKKKSAHPRPGDEGGAGRGKNQGTQTAPGERT